MIAKIIVAAFLLIMLILLMWGAVIGIKENDKAFAVICSTGAGSVVGLLCGIVLGSLML